MGDLLRYLDVRLLLELNHALADHPRLYLAALFATDLGADICLLLTAAALWFWPQRAVARSLGAAAAPRVVTGRLDSRARLLVFGVAGVMAYIAARLTALLLDKDRPFATYLPVHGLPGAFDDLRTFGTFPSDHAALLGALPIAFARWSGALAWAWAALGAVLLVVRVAVGFHYPSDMLAGALLGMTAGALSMAVYERSAGVRRLALKVADGFSRWPHAVVLYALLGLVGLEFVMHFKHVLFVILWTVQWLA